MGCNFTLHGTFPLKLLSFFFHLRPPNFCFLAPSLAPSLPLLSLFFSRFCSQYLGSLREARVEGGRLPAGPARSVCWSCGGPAHVLRLYPRRPLPLEPGCSSPEVPATCPALRSPFEGKRQCKPLGHQSGLLAARACQVAAAGGPPDWGAEKIVKPGETGPVGLQGKSGGPCVTENKRRLRAKRPTEPVRVPAQTCIQPVPHISTETLMDLHS